MLASRTRVIYCCLATQSAAPGCRSYLQPWKHWPSRSVQPSHSPTIWSDLRYRPNSPPRISSDCQEGQIWVKLAEPRTTESSRNQQANSTHTHKKQPLRKSWSFRSASHRVSPDGPGWSSGRSLGGPPGRRNNYVLVTTPGPVMRVCKILYDVKNWRGKLKLQSYGQFCNRY